MQIRPTERGKSWFQKLTSKVSLSPKLFGVDIPSHLALQQRLEGWENQRKWEVIFSQGAPVSLLHPYQQPLLMAQGTKAAKDMHWSWGPAHSLVVVPPQLLVLHLRTPHAQQPAEGTEELNPWAKYCQFWLVKLIIEPETWPCPAEEGATPSIAPCQEGALQAPHLGCARWSAAVKQTAVQEQLQQYVSGQL